MKKQFSIYKNNAIKIAFAVLLFFAAGMQQVEAQTVPPTNAAIGTGASYAPPGWTSYSTDVCDASGYTYNLPPGNGQPSYPWTPALSNVPAGQIYFVTGLYNEFATTTISGLTAGKSYTFTFYAADLQSTASTYYNSNYSLKLYNQSDGTIYLNCPFTGGSTQNNWQTFTYTFTATAPTLPIAFGWNGFYGQTWGVYVGPNAVTAVPCSALTSAASTTTQTVIAGSPITNVTYSTLTTNVTVSPALPAGVLGNLNNGVYTISGTPTVPKAPTDYVVTFTGTTCATTTQTFNLAVGVTATNTCPVNTVNLATHTTGVAPDGSTLKWFKAPDFTTPISNASTVGAGTYYAAYVANDNSCKSPFSSGVLVTITLCPITIANVCPATTVNLNTTPELATSTNQPANTTKTFHTGTPATNANKIAGSDLGAGTYYVAFYDSVGGCYSPTTKLIVTITACSNPDFNVALLNKEITGNVSTNDGIPTGTSYGTPVAVNGNPSGGTINMNSNGTYTFTGTVPGVFTYNVPICATGVTPPACPTSPLVITVVDPVISTNPPVANTDIAVGAINTQLTIDILSNDKVGNTGGTLGTPTIVSSGANGATATIVNGKLVYTPATGFVGKDTVTYQVCETPGGKCATASVVITVNPAAAGKNTVASDDFVVTTGTAPATGTVLTNDRGALTTSVLTVTAQGSAASPITLTGKGTYYVNTNGTYGFTPAPGFSGSVALPYTVCDDSNPSTCANATIYVTVKEVCYVDANLSTDNVSATPTGISLLKRAGAGAGVWPGVRKSAFVAIESNRKGFVVTRMTSDPAKTGDANYITNITTPQEGMLIYDTFTNCLKLYDGTKWDCFSTPACE